MRVYGPWTLTDTRLSGVSVRVLFRQLSKEIRLWPHEQHKLHGNYMCQLKLLKHQSVCHNTCVHIPTACDKSK